MSIVTIAVVGAGGRGGGYAQWVQEHPDRARVVAVADPDPVRRDRVGDAHEVPAGARFASWEALADARVEADAVLVCTQDDMHVEPALRFIGDGYHVLLEKPIAPREDECVRVTDAARDAGRVFAVAHVLRYTPHTRLVKRLLDEGTIGEIVSVEHLEPVGWWHMAHSFVRGNWRNEAESSNMLLAKSCHDIDWLGFVVGRPFVRTSSFGSLTYFTRENQPEGAADRCLDCPLERTCAYSATRIYLDRAKAGERDWPLRTVVNEVNVENVEEALRTGPYGRCVWACDNDVVDHQVVNLEFEGGITASFTMTGFTPMWDRHTRIFGTQGMLETDGEIVRVYSFANQEWSDYDANREGAMDAGGGHGGGDGGLMDAFTTAVAAGDPALVSTGAEASMASHRAVFAAERARKQGMVEAI